jgi:hypothetical protein
MCKFTYYDLYKVFPQIEDLTANNEHDTSHCQIFDKKTSKLFQILIEIQRKSASRRGTFRDCILQCAVRKRSLGDDVCGRPVD